MQNQQGKFLRINEIFYSIQGESTQSGRPCIFIRLTGCSLRCHYCDTKYAYYQGDERSLDSILAEIGKYPSKLVQITGGEPLEQSTSIDLMQLLQSENYEVMLETHGQESIERVPKGVRIVMDVKTPASGAFNNSSTAPNIKMLRPGDELKFVVKDEKDYAFAKEFLQEYKPGKEITILMSPVQEKGGDYRWLAEQMLQDGIEAKMQLQLQKILWGAKRGV